MSARPSPEDAETQKGAVVLTEGAQQQGNETPDLTLTALCLLSLQSGDASCLAQGTVQSLGISEFLLGQWT